MREPVPEEDGDAALGAQRVKGAGLKVDRVLHGLAGVRGPVGELEGEEDRFSEAEVTHPSATTTYSSSNNNNNNIQMVYKVRAFVYSTCLSGLSRPTSRPCCSSSLGGGGSMCLGAGVRVIFSYSSLKLMANWSAEKDSLKFVYLFQEKFFKGETLCCHAVCSGGVKKSASIGR